jgi:hypothetical protein
MCNGNDKQKMMAGRKVTSIDRITLYIMWTNKECKTSKQSTSMSGVSDICWNCQNKNSFIQQMRVDDIYEG